MIDGHPTPFAGEYLGGPVVSSDPDAAGNLVAETAAAVAAGPESSIHVPANPGGPTANSPEPPETRGASSASVAARLETLCATMETEFGEFRAREDRAKAAIHLLWKNLHTREEALHDSLRRNEGFEQQLSTLREDFSGLRQRVVSSASSPAQESGASRVEAKADAYEALKQANRANLATIALIEERAAAFERENGTLAARIEAVVSDRDARAERSRIELAEALRDRDDSHGRELDEQRMRIESERDAATAGLHAEYEEAARVRAEAHGHELRQLREGLESERDALASRLQAEIDEIVRDRSEAHDRELENLRQVIESDAARLRDEHDAAARIRDESHDRELHQLNQRIESERDTARRIEDSLRQRTGELERALLGAESELAEATAKSAELLRRATAEADASRAASAAGQQAAAEASALRAELAQRDLFLADLAAGHDTLAHAMKALRDELGDAVAREASAVDRGAALLEELVRREESNADLSARLAEMTRARHEAGSAAMLVAGRVQSIEQTLMGLEHERTLFEASIDALRIDASEFAAKAAATQAELDSTIARHHEAETSWRETYGEIAGALETAATAAQAREDLLLGKIERLGEEKAASTLRLAELSAQGEIYRGEAEVRRENEVLLEDRLRATEGELARLSEDHAAARSRIEELSMDVAANNAALASSRDEYARVQREAGGMRGEIDELSGALEARDRELRQLGDALSAGAVEIGRQEREAASLGEQLHRAGAEHARIASALSARESELGEAIAAIGTLRDEARAREEDVARRNGEAQRAHSALTIELDAATALIGALHVERDGLQSSAARLAARIDEQSLALRAHTERRAALEDSLAGANAMVAERDALLSQAAAEAQATRERLLEETARGGVRQAEIDRLRGHADVLAKTVEERTDSLAASTAQILSLQEAAVRDEKRHAREMETKLAEVAALFQHRAELETAIDGLVADLEEARSREAEAHGAIVQRDLALGNAHDRHLSLEAAFETLTVQADDLRLRLAESERREDLSGKRGDELEGALGERTRACENATSRIALLEEAAGTLRANIAELSARRRDLENHQLALQEEIAQGRNRIAELTGEKSSAEQGRAQLADAYRALERRKKEADEICAGLRKSVAEREERIGSLTAEAGGLEHAVAQARADLEASARAERQAQSRIESFRLEIAGLERRLAKAEEDQAGLERDLSGLREAHAALGAREADATVRGNSLAEELGATQDALKSASGSLSRANYEVARMEGEVRCLGDEIEQLRTKELPEALEQKVRAFREALDLKAEIELLRSQIW